jgi:hypothetical protein
MNDYYYKKINLGFDLTSYCDFFISPNMRSGPVRQLDVDTLKNNIPEIKNLCEVMEKYDWIMWNPRVLFYDITQRYSEIHVDSTNVEQSPIPLSFNIGILNAESMFNRWFKFPNEADDSDLNWTYQRHIMGWKRRSKAGMVDKNMDKIMNMDMDDIIKEYQVCSTIISGCYFFRADIPHCADGRHNNDPRALLSCRWMNIRTCKLMDWDSKQEMIDIVTKHYS